MKRWLLALVTVGLLPSLACAGSVTLAWNAPQEGARPNGYVVEYWQGSGEYRYLARTLTTSYRATNVVPPYPVCYRVRSWSPLATSNYGIRVCVAQAQ